MPRLTRKVMTKRRTPSSTVRQVSPEKKSDKKSSIPLQFTPRFQNRCEQIVHDLFRSTFEIELRLLRHFPELVEPACARAFECEHLDQQVENVRSLHEPRFETL